jgi:hypothetical protein
MKYDLHTPCSDCPFRKEGGIRLTRARVMEVAACTENPGGEFPCHKTVKRDEDDEDDEDSCDSYDHAAAKHCAGALVFAEKQGTSSQMIRIAERLGMYDASKLRGHDDVFDSVEDMLDTAIGRQKPRARPVKPRARQAPNRRARTP